MTSYFICVKSLLNLGVLTPFVAFGKVETSSVQKPQLFGNRCLL